jgi:hypothetical protein
MTGFKPPKGTSPGGFSGVAFFVTDPNVKIFLSTGTGVVKRWFVNRGCVLWP